MLYVLYPTYTFTVTVQDRDEPNNNVGIGVGMGLGMVAPPVPGKRFFLGDKTGCDEVLKVIKDALATAGLKNYNVRLERFEHKG